MNLKSQNLGSKHDGPRLETRSSEVTFVQTRASPVRPDDVYEGIWQNALFMLISPEPCPADELQDTVLAVKC